MPGSLRTDRNQELMWWESAQRFSTKILIETYCEPWNHIKFQMSSGPIDACRVISSHDKHLCRFCIWKSHDGGSLYRFQSSSKQGTWGVQCFTLGWHDVKSNNTTFYHSHPSSQSVQFPWDPGLKVSPDGSSKASLQWSIHQSAEWG